MVSLFVYWFHDKGTESPASKVFVKSGWLPEGTFHRTDWTVAWGETGVGSRATSKERQQ